jgi:serine/threonine protein kinase
LNPGGPLKFGLLLAYRTRVAFMMGQTISYYKILEKLGEGGMGVVSKAHDTKLNRVIALTVLPAHLSASEQGKAKFIRETMAARALNCANVCRNRGIKVSTHPSTTSAVSE